MMHLLINTFLSFSVFFLFATILQLLSEKNEFFFIILSTYEPSDHDQLRSFDFGNEKTLADETFNTTGRSFLPLYQILFFVPLYSGRLGVFRA